MEDNLEQFLDAARRQQQALTDMRNMLVENEDAFIHQIVAYLHEHGIADEYNSVKVWIVLKRKEEEGRKLIMQFQMGEKLMTKEMRKERNQSVAQAAIAELIAGAKPNGSPGFKRRP